MHRSGPCALSNVTSKALELAPPPVVNYAGGFRTSVLVGHAVPLTEGKGVDFECEGYNSIRSLRPAVEKADAPATMAGARR